jgi:putative transposase
MPSYTRAFVSGGTFFFTVVTYHRRPLFKSARARALLREVIAGVQERRPFEMEAIVLLPEHLHCVWTLPPDDHDFSTRWRKLKEEFTRRFLDDGGVEGRATSGQRRKGLRAVWRQRFWEHTIRDELDFERHVDYIHYNPVKHGLAACPQAWEWSTLPTWVARGVYESDWCCRCAGVNARVPDFEAVANTVGE